MPLLGSMEADSQVHENRRTDRRAVALGRGGRQKESRKLDRLPFAASDLILCCDRAAVYCMFLCKLPPGFAAGLSEDAVYCFVMKRLSIPDRYNLVDHFVDRHI